MNKLKTMLAVLLALMLMIPCALAEDSTIYSLSLLDPVLTQGDETVLDLTGLNLDLVAMVTDGVTQGLSLELYSGENYAYLTSLQMQFAEEGIVLFLDGMTNSYSLSYDALAAFTGDEAAGEIVSSLPQTLSAAMLRSTLDDLGNQMQTAFGQAGTLFTRWYPVLICEDRISFDANGKCVIPVSLTQDESLAMTANAQNAIRSMGADADFGFEGLSANGTMTVYGSDAGYTGYALDISGVICVNGEEGSYTLTAEISDEAMNGQLDITDPSGNTATLLLEPFETDDATVTDSHAVYIYNNEGDLGYLVLQTAEDDGHWTYVQMCLYGEAENGEDQVLGFNIVTDFYAEADHSWGITVYEYTGDGSEDYQDYFFTYLGFDEQTDDGIPYLDGYIDMGRTEGDVQTDLSFRLLEMRTESDAGDWALSYADSVDVMSMDETATNAAQMGLLGVIGEVGATLQEQYPIFEELFANFSLN